jgi:hypothetical protein
MRGKDAYRTLDGKLEWMRPLRSSRHRLQNNIRRDLRKIGWEGLD